MLILAGMGGSNGSHGPLVSAAVPGRRRGLGIGIVAGAAFLDGLAGGSPVVFRPDLLNSERQPNRAFGQGGHYCVGATLARLEAQIAFTTLLRRFPGLRLGAPHSTLRWRKGVVLRGLEALPVKFS
jgi:cytochrome P450